MAFRFVHCADVHLDSPLRSLALRNGELAELIGNATRRAFSRVVDLCLREKVDALLIAGDLYDGDQTSMRTALFLGNELKRLALSMAGRCTRINDLRARDATAAKDLPYRRTALRIAEAKIVDILEELGQRGCSNPRQLLLSTSSAARLRRCLESLSGVTAAQREAAAELAAAKDRYDQAKVGIDRVQVLPDDSTALIELKSAVGAAETDDSLSRLRLADRACRTHSNALIEKLAALAPWQGDAELLATIDVPGRNERERLEQEISATRRNRDRWSTETDRLRDEVFRLTRSRKGVIAEHGLIGDEAAAACRAEREEAWTAHVRTLDEASARLFEQALRADDVIVGSRFQHVASLSELRALDRSLTTATADLEIHERSGMST